MCQLLNVLSFKFSFPNWPCQSNKSCIYIPQKINKQYAEQSTAMQLLFFQIGKVLYLKWLSF